MSSPFMIGQVPASQLDQYQVLDYSRTGVEFSLGHLPGAIHVPKSVVWSQVDGVQGMLPKAPDLSQELGRLGLNPQGRVLVYDHGNGLYAARLGWALINAGFQSVTLLEGGLDLWKRNKNPVKAGFPSKVPATPVQLNLSKTWYATLDEVQNRSGVTLLLDTRSRGEFAGSDRRSKRGGRIPGAVFWDWTNALASDGLRFKAPDVLKMEFEALGITENTEIITYCQSGVRASHSLYALVRAGFHKVKVYDGSWEEWGNRTDTPLEIGGPNARF